jgi:hypothetical protein
MSEETERFVSVDQLPDDPLSMPPPYWQSGVGIRIIERSVTEIAEKLLPRLVAAHEAWKAISDNADGGESRLPEELYTLRATEDTISHLADITIFMAAIGAEEAINQFAVFNLHRDSAEVLEKLGPPEKLILAAAIVGAAPVKGTAPYESIERLTAYRNAAAHGHCVDRLTTSLPAFPAKISELKNRLNDYLRVKAYLQEIGKNPYTSLPLVNDDDIADSLAVINRYKFENIRGQAYDIQPPAGV